MYGKGAEKMVVILIIIVHLCISVEYSFANTRMQFFFAQRIILLQIPISWAVETNESNEEAAADKNISV